MFKKIAVAFALAAGVVVGAGTIKDAIANDSQQVARCDSAADAVITAAKGQERLEAAATKGAISFSDWRIEALQNIRDDGMKSWVLFGCSGRPKSAARFDALINKAL